MIHGACGSALPPAAPRSGSGGELESEEGSRRTATTIPCPHMRDTSRGRLDASRIDFSPGGPTIGSRSSPASRRRGGPDWTGTEKSTPWIAL